VEIVPKIVYTFICILDETFRISSRDIKKGRKQEQKARGEFFHHMKGEWVIKGGKQKGNILSSFSLFFFSYLWFRYLTAVALASHRKYTSLTWSWHADSSRYFIVFPPATFSKTPIGVGGASLYSKRSQSGTIWA